MLTLDVNFASPVAVTCYLGLIISDVKVSNGRDMPCTMGPHLYKSFGGITTVASREFVILKKIQGVCVCGGGGGKKGDGGGGDLQIRFWFCVKYEIEHTTSI